MSDTLKLVVKLAPWIAVVATWVIASKQRDHSSRLELYKMKFTYQNLRLVEIQKAMNTIIGLRKHEAFPLDNERIMTGSAKAVVVEYVEPFFLQAAKSVEAANLCRHLLDQDLESKLSTVINEIFLRAYLDFYNHRHRFLNGTDSMPLAEFTPVMLSYIDGLKKTEQEVSHIIAVQLSRISKTLNTPMTESEPSLCSRLSTKMSPFTSRFSNRFKSFWINKSDA